MDRRKRGDAPFLIVKYLGDKGPANYEELSKNLDIPHRTVEHDIKKILLKRHDLVKKLSNGKYALKWHVEEEDAVINLKRKLLRNPQPEELSGLIKKTPGEAKDLLFKYIPDYREPTEDEIASSAKVLWKMIVLGSLNLPRKKDLFEKGIAKVLVEGLDQETLNEILENRPSVSLDDARNYITEFPEMKPDITQEDEGNQIMYKVEWSDEAKRVLNAIDSWNQTAKTRIPLRFDKEGKYPFSGSNVWEDYLHTISRDNRWSPRDGGVVSPPMQSSANIETILP